MKMLIVTFEESIPDHLKQAFAKADKEHPEYVENFSPDRDEAMIQLDDKLARVTYHYLKNCSIMKAIHIEHIEVFA